MSPVPVNYAAFRVEACSHETNGREKVSYVRNLVKFMRYTQGTLRRVNLFVAGFITLFDRQTDNLSCRKAGRLVYVCA
jgi:hypothetical protein